jgi:hypothetical protein
MAVRPGTYNIVLQRAADFSIVVQFKDSTGTPINLTGWTVTAQAWDEERTTKYADFTVTYTARSTGTVTLSLARADTANFPDELRYDVLLENGSGLREYYLEGIIIADQGYTR